MAETSKKVPKVSIIVLNWNGCSHTIECIESLKGLNYSNYEILIVDNGSTDRSEEILRKKFPELSFIQTGTNLGFAGGANTGIRHALKGGTEYIILLNNDTIVAQDFAGELIKAAEKDKKAGILCSKIFFYDNPKTIWYAGAYYNQWLGWGRHKGYKLHDNVQYDKEKETGRPCGCSMMVTREFCEKVGLLDEEYFCYCEDLDWGMRAKASGFRVIYVPTSKVWHKVSKSTGGYGNAKSLYYNVRNTLRCLDKNRPLPFFPRSLRSTAVIITSVLSLFTMSVPKITGLKHIRRGVRDYRQDKFGSFE